MLIVKPPLIEDSDYTLFYSENLRFTIDFRNRYQLQWCGGAFCHKHILCVYVQVLPSLFLRILRAAWGPCC